MCITSAVLLQIMVDDGREALGERRTRGFQSAFAVHIRDVMELSIMYRMAHLSRFNVHLSTVAFSVYTIHLNVSEWKRFFFLS